MKKKGFTLIELIISVTIFSIVIVSVYGVFYMGLKTWRRAQGEKSLQEIRMAFLKMEKELKNTFFFSDTKFKGTSKDMSFPLVVSDKVYTITYSVNENEDSGLSQILRTKDEEEKEISPPMKSIKFQYAAMAEDIEWKDNWNEDDLPSGIRISLEDEETCPVPFADRAKSKRHGVYSKTIFLKQPDFKIQ
ncbi:MAG: prepilin-type N-terminal cleavage/methylation domain-containing protein [Candidatus Gorgyraea atricola]|nr:prepilin-type N-terminal cleavage/methylation domain-containing protein [Candidatus Gorgyraea atricola]